MENNNNLVRFLLTFFLGFIGSIIINHTTLKPEGYKSRTLAYFFLSIITSGDAMFLGVPLAFSTNSYINLIIIISLTTFFVCLTGLLIRNKLRNICDDKIQIIGSIVLFIFAFKSLI